MRKKKEIITDPVASYEVQYIAWLIEVEWPNCKKCLATGCATKEEAIEATKPYVHLGFTWVEERLIRTVYTRTIVKVCM